MLNQRLVSKFFCLAQGEGEILTKKILSTLDSLSTFLFQSFPYDINHFHSISLKLANLSFAPLQAMYPFDWQQRTGSDASYVDTVWSLEHQELRRRFLCDHKATKVLNCTEFCNLEVSLEVARQDLLCIL